MSKPWSKLGAWALDAERAEAEEKEEEQQAAAAAAAAAATAPSASFPSLKEASTTKQKKKHPKMSLQEFTVTVGLTPDEMLRLPTGPKERSAEEMQHGRLGGGFSSYGRTGGGRGGDSGGDWGGNRRSYGDDDRRGPREPTRDFDSPSRADEADNWAVGKKPVMPSYDSGRNVGNAAAAGRYGSLGGGGGFSRADETDNWVMNKKPINPPRVSSFGTGFRESRPEPERWERGVEVGGGGGGQERRRLVLDPPSRLDSAPAVVKSDKPNPFGAARPREQILAEKGLDWKKIDLEIETKKISSGGSRPGSSHSNSRPGSSQSGRSEGVAALQGVEKPKPKVNPFGDAKPREVLLQERGLDWKKIDLELDHRAVDRPESEEEKNLREDIDRLKREFEKESASNVDIQGFSETQAGWRDLIVQKEKELEQLIRDLDDKVRFGEKAVDRPGSGAGRAPGFLERPPSQAGSFESSRSFDFSERPRSRGTGDNRMRQGDDRRPFSGSRERGFLSNRDFGRSSSRERW